MDVFDLVAKISLDTSGYESSLNKSKGLLSKFSGGITSKAVAVGNLVSGAISKVAGKVAGFSKQTITTGMSFDKAMAQVAATLGKTVNDISQGQYKATVRGKKFVGNLRDYAKFVGENTEYSATQAAQALNYMALAGYDTQKSMQTLPNVLNLASAGAMDMATASDRVTDAETALGLTGKETATMIDQIALTSSKANANVDQLSAAFLSVGANARSMKDGAIPITKEMSMVLGAMADNNIKGAEAGTNLRNILRRFAKPTDASAAAMEKLGVSAYDAKGQLRDLPEIFTEIGKAEQGMSTKEKDKINYDLFNAYDVKAAKALMETSTERWNQLSTAIDGAAGSAEKMANTQLDNLDGDITAFKSALEATQIAISDKVTPALRKFVQIGKDGLQSLAKAINNGDVKGIGDAFANTIIAAADRLIKYLPQIMEVLTKVLNAITNALVKIIPEILPQLIPVLISSFAKIGAAVVKNIPAIISSLIQGIGASFDKPGDLLASSLFLAFVVRLKSKPFGSAIAGIFSNLGNIGSIASKALLPAIKGIGVAFKGLFAILAANPIALVITLIASLTVGLIALYRHNEKFRNAVNALFSSIGNFLAGVGKGFATFFTQTLPGAFSRAGEAFRSLGHGFAEVFSAIGSGFANAGKAIGSFVVDSVQSQINLARNILQGFAKAISSIGQAVVSGFRSMGRGVSSAISHIREGASSLGSHIRSVFTRTIPNAVSHARNAFSNLGSNAGKAFSNLVSRTRTAGRNIARVFTKTIPDAGRQMVKHFRGLPSQIAKAMGSLGSRMAQVGRNAMKAFRNAFNGIRNVGRNIVTGLWKGISGAFGWLRDKITGFGGKVIKWFQKAFDINSPSKKMEKQVGKYVAQGMVVGWEKEQKNAVKSAQKLASSVVQSANNVVTSANYDSIADRIYKDIDDPKYHLTAKQRAAERKKKRQEQEEARANRKTTKKTVKKSKLPSDEELEKMREELQEEQKYYNNPKLRWQKRKEQEQKEREEKEKEKEEEKKGKKTKKKSSQKKDDDDKDDKKSKKKSSKKKSTSDDKVMTEDEFNSKMISNAQKRVTALKKADKMSEAQEVSFWNSMAKKVDKGSVAYAQIMAKAAQAQKAQQKKTFKDAEDALSMHELKQNKKSAKYEASYWNTIRKQYKMGTDERKKADKKYYTARNKIQAETLKNTKQYWSTYKVYHKTTLSDEVQYYNVARKQFAKGTKERISMDKLYFTKKESLQKKQESAEKKYLNSIESANKKYLNSRESAEKKYRESKLEAEKKLSEALQDAEKDYQEALDKTKEKLKDRKDELTGAFSVLEKFDIGDMLSPADATANVDSQFNAMREWVDGIEVLRSKIGGTQLFDDIQKLGVNGLQKVRALNEMSTAQLQSNVQKYQQIFDMAEKEAHAELDKTIAEENAKSYKAYTDAIAKANEEYSTSLAEAQKTLNESLAKAADTYNTSVTKAYDTFKSSMEKVGLKVSNSSKKVKSAIKSTKGTLASTLESMGTIAGKGSTKVTSKVSGAFKKLAGNTTKYGKDAMKNFADGISSGAGAVGKAIDKVLKDKVYKKIHFSEPDEGPLADFHTYAPDMMSLFAKGITDNGYKIGDALDKSIQLKDMTSRVQDAMSTIRPQAQGALEIPGLPTLTPVSQNQSNNQRPVDLHITMNVDRTAFARIVYRLNKEEMQRVGVSLATGAGM